MSEATQIHGTVDMEALKAELIRDEGIRLKPYRDGEGFLTIGIGHNLDAKGLTRAQVETIFKDDVADVLAGLSAELPWWRALDGVRKRVLVNLGFNLGVDGLILKWPNTLAMIASGDYAGAAEAMRTNRVWVSQVGKRAERLAEMMERGEG